MRKSQRGASASRMVCQSEMRNTARSTKAKSTMKRKVKKIDGTLGTVDHAASLNLRRRRLQGVGNELLQQQGVAEIVARLLEDGTGRGVGSIIFERL